jgi:DDE superfamily endonuclease
MSSADKRILYLSEVHKGSKHDYAILQQCFTAEQPWFKELRVRLDSGFQGFAGLYKYEAVFIPHKKKRVAKGQSNELSDEQKLVNKEQASRRIVVEHSIGGMKRYRLLCNRLRLKGTALINTVIGVCAGLWNFAL